MSYGQLILRLIMGVKINSANSIAVWGCLKCLFSSSGSFGFCQTFKVSGSIITRQISPGRNFCVSPNFFAGLDFTKCNTFYSGVTIAAE